LRCGCILGALAGLAAARILSPLEVAVVAVGLVLVALTVSRPEYGLLLLVLISYLRLSDIAISHHGLPSIAKPFIGLLVGVILLRWVLYGEAPRNWQKPLALVVLYGLVVFLSLFTASDLERAMNAVDDFWKDGAIMFYCALAGSKVNFPEWFGSGSCWRFSVRSACINMTGSYITNFGVLDKRG
jgi:hypothetical protein